MSAAEVRMEEDVSPHQHPVREVVAFAGCDIAALGAGVVAPQVMLDQHAGLSVVDPVFVTAGFVAGFNSDAPRWPRWCIPTVFLGALAGAYALRAGDPVQAAVLTKIGAEGLTAQLGGHVTRWLLSRAPRKSSTMDEGPEPTDPAVSEADDPASVDGDGRPPDGHRMRRHPGLLRRLGAVVSAHRRR